jgi:hypothetical protein
LVGGETDDFGKAERPVTETRDDIGSHTSPFDNVFRELLSKGFDFFEFALETSNEESFFGWIGSQSSTTIPIYTTNTTNTTNTTTAATTSRTRPAANPQRLDFCQIDRSGNCHAWSRWFLFAGQDISDDFCSASALVDIPSDFLQLSAGFFEIVFVGVGIGCFIDDGGEKERVFEKSLDGFYEEGSEIPSMRERRGDALCVREIILHCGSLRELLEMGESGGMAGNVLFVRSLQLGNLSSATPLEYTEIREIRE